MVEEGKRARAWGGGGGVWSREIYNTLYTEPVFLNVYGAQESIPMNEFNEFRLPM
jgi:hypothetical protein